jgi:valyl-tRNA synthetase
MENILKLLHPITPFITEELWHSLPGNRSSLMLEPFPKAEKYQDKEAEEAVNLLMGIISAIRNIRSEVDIHPSKTIKAGIICSDPEKRAIISTHAKSITTMTRVEELTVLESGECPKEAASFIYEEIQIFVPMAGLIDAAKEIEKIAKEMGKLQASLKQTEGKLKNEKFLANAPAEVVEKEREKAQGFKATLEKLAEDRSRLEGLL